ncbi:helix-turn-helix domain-containing protein [Burkholderia glumae]|uniref:Helix-turn-helix transcriptional regulator n=1 Tax=Burkholderia glumae TaxID=337 RepID=A0AAP9Y6G4_BURGL|nr:helix-turn-helix transcriptional regulator [Burkholderia glumae]ACR32652.1 XRE family transcriptional regulator [Burkholderia glumae BGR1]AJY62278.1 helix-turn-helix family protein [Burkholderia glumae LMG 2196 = ATCC 33617]PNK93208.1 XRE family transcriptional regulator [Burkholderia glumae]QPQ94669.1 helix-turn-helix transcriptional regulator [Burkholderia glumae]QQM89485.1 helix-turn-helix transcriptional regulator [Burkholderia glumae]
MLFQALKLLRRYHGMTQKDLAARLGISNSYLSEIETGVKKDSITIDLLEKYAAVFGIPVSSLLLFSEQISPERRADRLRVQAASKILKVLSWIDEQEKIGA